MKPNNIRSLEEIREAREALEKELNDLTTQAENDQRDFTVEEAKRINTLLSEIKEEQEVLDAREAIEQKRLADADRQRRIDRQYRGKDTLEDEGRKMSWHKFIKGAYDGKHEGLEREIVEEGHNEAKNYKHATSLRNPLPAAFLQIRDQDTSTTYKGKETIPTELGALIPALRPNLNLAALGADIMTGLTHPLEFPRQTSLMSASWKGEKVAADETDANFDTIELTPHRLAAWSEFTRDLLFQSDIAIDRWMRQELQSAIQIKVDADAIAATDGGMSPTGAPNGLLNISGTNDASIGGNGATPDWEDLVKFYRLLKMENADIGSISWYSNPLVAEMLLTTEKVTTTTGEMLLKEIGGSLAGFPARFSTQVPSNLTDSTYEDQSALIFGIWSQFILAQFAGIDVIVDPFTKGKEAMIQVITHSWWDFDVRHPEAFSIAKDIGGTAVQ